MSDEQACKSEDQHRIDTLEELANAERELRSAKTRFEQAQWEVVKAAESLLEWRENWSRLRNAALSCYPAAVPVERVLEDAQATIDRFCAEVNARNADLDKAISALTPEDGNDALLAPVQSPSPESSPQASETDAALEEFMQRPGAWRWTGTAWDGPIYDVGNNEQVEVLFSDGKIYTGLRTGMDWSPEMDPNALAYRIVEAPTDAERPSVVTDQDRVEQTSPPVPAVEIPEGDEPAEIISTLTGDPAIEPESGLHGEPAAEPVHHPAAPFWSKVLVREGT